MYINELRRVIVVKLRGKFTGARKEVKALPFKFSCRVPAEY
jgi:hypothetical protein